MSPLTLSLSAAACPVCGSGFMDGDVVMCGACRTPHHRQCWEFTGACSMFSCGCRGAVRAK